MVAQRLSTRCQWEDSPTQSLSKCPNLSNKTIPPLQCRHKVICRTPQPLRALTPHANLSRPTHSTVHLIFDVWARHCRPFRISPRRNVLCRNPCLDQKTARGEWYTALSGSRRMGDLGGCVKVVRVTCVRRVDIDGQRTRAQKFISTVGGEQGGYDPQAMHSRAYREGK